jgi:hypothetical protein
VKAFQTAGRNISIYKMEILLITLTSINTLGIAIQGVANQVDINTLDWYRIFLMSVNIVVNWTTTMILLVKQTGKQVIKGKTLFDEDENTRQFKKSDLPETNPEPPKP